MHHVPVYVILGATGKTGSLLAQNLRKSGANLMLADNDETKLHNLAKELDVNAFLLDTTIPVEIEACMIAANEIFGHVDGMVCCINSCSKIDGVISTNIRSLSSSHKLTCALGAVRAGIKVMCSSGGSIIIVADRDENLKQYPINASLHRSLIRMTKSIASSYAEYGIRVNIVSKDTEDYGQNFKDLNTYEPVLTNDLFAKKDSSFPQKAVDITRELLINGSLESNGQVFNID